MTTERLQKVLAHWGVASRRHAEMLIRSGQVFVNGQRAQLGDKVDPTRDRIEYRGRRLTPPHPPRRLYLLLHKPRGVLCTCNDPQGRTTVLDLLPPAYQRVAGLHPVGRLDANSSGALLLTNDGAFTYYLSHPRHHIPKTYRVWLQGQPPEKVLQRWREGIPLDGVMTLPAAVQLLRSEGDRSLLEIILHEGRNRQIRRVADQLGYPVVALQRIAIGPVHLGNLPPRAVRPLSNRELAALSPSTQRQS
ncbi:rRNA pseudouridine synthase [Thermosynechococcus sp. HN-54]|uniref:pseudouridine synthase n=1 Tax=Thermosynechococcus sp. HN-54 TaxID=2933959 RepID=UPI00202CE43D|nr:pseudouridine synthase [Thermosynechococcus sp. HN-54]URR35784.1 rRNA pseudouridine synthase [Thermosynechococcus sp. HN-54]